MSMVKGFGRRAILALAALAIVLGLALVPAIPASAEDPTPGQTRRWGAVFDRLKEVPNALLENTLRRERHWLAHQRRVMDRAAETADRLQELLQAARDEGKDVAPLQALLELFRDRLDESRESQDAAAAILEAPKGFAADGRVTDRQDARDTVVEAYRALSEAHRLLVQAMRDLRRDLRDWRREHRPRPTASPVAAS
ncbi:MAG: hypothetical protein ACUVX9_10265 [Anaerolineae bacterium]